MPPADTDRPRDSGISAVEDWSSRDQQHDDDEAPAVADRISNQDRHETPHGTTRRVPSHSRPNPDHDWSRTIGVQSFIICRVADFEATSL